jgi:hypothetical protein
MDRAPASQRAAKKVLRKKLLHGMSLDDAAIDLI